MHLAFNYINIDPSSTLVTSTLSIGGNLFSDLSPIWQLVLGVGVAILVVVALFRILSH